MNILDSHVEALAFDYLNLGFFTVLNNFWTWFALLTAALSFWKIRSSGCTKPDEPVPVIPDPLVEEFTPDAVTGETVVSNGVTEDVEGVRKGKFTVYYEDEDAQCRCGESDVLLTASTEGWEERDGCETEWWKRWGSLLEFRNGVNENGWYTCQDLTELNGNVVRFWDGGLSFCTSGAFTREPLYSSSCIRVW